MLWRVVFTFLAALLLDGLFAVSVANGGQFGDAAGVCLAGSILATSNISSPINIFGKYVLILVVLSLCSLGAN